MGGGQSGEAAQGRSGEGEDSVATEAGKHYDVEVDCATAAHGKLDACVELSGDDNETKMKVSIVRTDPFMNRLTSISSQPSASGLAPISFNYSYNSANQRTRATLTDGSYWLYEYDTLGQVKSAKRYWSDGTPVAGQQFQYTFDDIGNRTQTQSGGDQSGAGLRPASYFANNLNQLTNRDVPGTNDVIGVALATNSVTVNGQAAYRKVEYFRGTVGTNNTSSPAWLGVAVVSGGNTNTGNLLLPKTPQTFMYDLDGNLTNDGLWSYTWDGEDRLTSITSQTNIASSARQKVDCQYDSQWRRTQKVVSTWNGSTYVPQSTNRFIYDGWNLVAVFDENNNLLQSFTWGTDVSGSMQGVGGVGGLISMTVYSDTNAGTYFYVCDGNGNVMALVNASNGTVAAQYEYSPFGEPIRATGPLAKLNPFLFSTKFYDWETGFYYYGYRYYDPITGRWPNRDPLGEPGFEHLRNNRVNILGDGMNLYEFVRNFPVGRIDGFGLQSVLYFIGCFDKRIHPTSEGQCECLCVIDGSLEQDCYKTCVACSSLNNPRKACECALRARKNTSGGGVPTDFQIKEACKNFPDCDIPLPKLKPKPKEPEFP